MVSLCNCGVSLVTPCILSWHRQTFNVACGRPQLLGSNLIASECWPRPFRRHARTVGGPKCAHDTAMCGLAVDPHEMFMEDQKTCRNSSCHYPVGSRSSAQKIGIGHLCWCCQALMNQLDIWRRFRPNRMFWMPLAAARLSKVQPWLSGVRNIPLQMRECGRGID